MLWLRRAVVPYVLSATCSCACHHVAPYILSALGVFVRDFSRAAAAQSQFDTMADSLSVKLKRDMMNHIGGKSAHTRE
jgi:hypothetical protein